MKREIQWLLGVLLVVLLVLPTVAGAASTRRGGSTTRFALALNGGIAGYLKSVTQSGNDITMTLPAGEMARGLTDWMLRSGEGKPLRETGAILFADFSGKVTQRLEFRDAVISEASFPALDAASKNAAIVTVRLHAEATRMVKGSGGSINLGNSSKQKILLLSNFRVDIPGVDPRSANKVGAIDLFTGDAARHRSNSLAMEIPQSRAQGFQSWYDSRQVKSGTVTLLDTRGKPFYIIRLGGLAISRLTSNWTTTGHSAPMMKADMTYGRIQVTFLH